MDKLSKKEVFSAILASNILAPHLEQDSELAELIKTPNHPNIHYFETPASAKKIAPTFRQRLNLLVAKNIFHNLEATKQLVAFMEEYPDSQIYNVTFNCQKKHYGVRCGWVNHQLHVICVMTGGHIPDELLGESVK
ncbi:MAG TPA: hypothetical protein VJM08_08075 [Anaerolineales bacterium]|nr:hypothetical protein [Anaerolineales bacterium]